MFFHHVGCTAKLLEVRDDTVLFKKEEKVYVNVLLKTNKHANNMKVKTQDKHTDSKSSHKNL